MEPAPNAPRSSRSRNRSETADESTLSRLAWQVFSLGLGLVLAIGVITYCGGSNDHLAGVEQDITEPVAEAGRSSRPTEVRPEPSTHLELRAKPISHQSSGAPSSPASKQTSPQALELTEWQRFPRSTWDFASRVRDDPCAIRHTDLFRHVELNPQDGVMSHSDRELLLAIVQSFQAPLGGAHSTLVATRQREIEEAARSGLTKVLRTRSLLMPNGVAATLMPVMPAGTVFNVQFGPQPGESDVHVAPLSVLPRTAEAVAYLDYLAAEFGGSVVNFFEATGLCPASMSGSIARRLVRSRHSDSEPSQIDDSMDSDSLATIPFLLR
jgi:hypothetical protein